MNKQVAIVTGTSSGIGLCVARNLLASGHSVVGISRQSPIPDLHLTHHFKADLSNPTELVLVSQEIKSLHSKINALIHCAGIMKSESASNLGLENIMHTFATNTVAPIYLTSSLTKNLSRGKGTVVFVGSVASELNLKGELIYSVSKAALNKATQNFAAELGQLGICYLQVNPSICLSPMTSSLSRDKFSYMESKSTVGRALECEEVADLICKSVQLGSIVSGSSFTCGGIVR
jgi:3-oxoacyl-[acyl-carrier protein] reductase